MSRCQVKKWGKVLLGKGNGVRKGLAARKAQRDCNHKQTSDARTQRAGRTG